jgi:hypothetical protein
MMSDDSDDSGGGQQSGVECKVLEQQSLKLEISVKPDEM